MGTKGHRSVLRICCGLALACLVFPGDCYAEMFQIGFEDLPTGDSLLDQYVDWGAYFRDGLSLSAGPAQGEVIGDGYGPSSRAFQPATGSSGFYLLFEDPITHFSARVFEIPQPAPAPEPQPEPEPEPQPEPEPEPPSEPEPAPEESPCVYMELYTLDGEEAFSFLAEVGPVHTPSEWTEMSFVSDIPVDGLWVYNRNYPTFAVDDLRFGSNGDFAVPVPSSLLLVFAAVPPIAAAGLRRVGRAKTR